MKSLKKRRTCNESRHKWTIIYSKNDGSIRVEVVDFEVEEFGGHDWESWYDLTKENAEKLYNELKSYMAGTSRKCSSLNLAKHLERSNLRSFVKSMALIMTTIHGRKKIMFY